MKQIIDKMIIIISGRLFQAIYWIDAFRLGIMNQFLIVYSKWNLVRRITRFYRPWTKDGLDDIWITLILEHLITSSFTLNRTNSHVLWFWYTLFRYSSWNIHETCLVCSNKVIERSRSNFETFKSSICFSKIIYGFFRSVNLNFC